jgi:hypothetical protein
VQFEVADRVWAKNANVNRLTSGKGRVLLIGAGWMGFLYLMHLDAKSTLNWLSDPESGA